MTIKKKFENAKNKAVELMKERPLETLAVAATVVTATAKAISTITEARNSSTWRREVKRREQKLRNNR